MKIQIALNITIEVAHRIDPDGVKQAIAHNIWAVMQNDGEGLTAGVPAEVIDYDFNVEVES